MRGDRLLSILLHLQHAGGRLTARVLAERLEVSERTIHRDMEALCAAGIPVYADRGAGGGWRLLDGYRTDLTGLSREELQSLLLLAVSKPAADLGLGDTLGRALLKLAAAVPAEHRQQVERIRGRLHVDGAPWHPRGDTEPFLAAVQEAVWNDRSLDIVYNGIGGVSERRIAPLGLVVKGSAWYVVGQTEEGLRTFRISRLLAVSDAGGGVPRPEGFDLAAYWEQSTAAFKAALPRYEAALRFAPEALPKLDRLRRDRVLRREPPAPDGSVVAWIRFDTLESAAGETLSFGPGVKAAAPPEFRASVRDRLAAMLGSYSDDGA